MLHLLLTILLTGEQLSMVESGHLVTWSIRGDSTTIAGAANVTLSQALAELKFSGDIALLRRTIEFSADQIHSDWRSFVLSPLQFIEYASANTTMPGISVSYYVKELGAPDDALGHGSIALWPDGRLKMFSLDGNAAGLPVQVNEAELEQFTRISLAKLQVGGANWRYTRSGRSSDPGYERFIVTVEEMHPRADICTGNSIQVNYQVNVAQNGEDLDFTRYTFQPHFFYFTYAGNNHDPAGPLLNNSQVQQRAANFAYQRFGVQGMRILVFAPRFLTIPPDEKLNTEFVGHTRSRTRNIRAQGKRLALHEVYMTSTHPTRQSVRMFIDSETGDVINAGYYQPGGSGGSTIDPPPLDLSKPINLEGRTVQLAWRKSFFLPEGKPIWISQGDHPARANWQRVYWNEALNLYILPKGDHSLVAKPVKRADQ